MKIFKKTKYVKTRYFNSVAYAGKISGGPGSGRPRRGYGGGAPRKPENFRKFAIYSLKNYKNALFLPIFQKN